MEDNKHAPEGGTMKQSPQSRKPANLSGSVRKQLNSYALAASAAGVGLLALTQPADAKIVYAKTHHRILVNIHYNLDLNHDGITDFILSNRSFFFSSHDLGAKLVIHGGSQRIAPSPNFVKFYSGNCGLSLLPYLPAP
jgi:hypothetical protein